MDKTALTAFRSPLLEMGEFEELRSRLQKSRGLFCVTGCIDSQKEHFTDGLAEDFDAVLIVTSNTLRAREMYENYRLFDKEVYLMPALDSLFFQADVHSNLLQRQRISVLKALVQGERVAVVTTIAAMMNHLMPFSEWKKEFKTLKTGEEIDTEQLKKYLVRCGYERCAAAEEPGQFSVRGNIIDIYLLTDPNPVRIELWGDEIDSIRSYDAESQRSIENLESIMLYPASELLVDEQLAKDALRQIKKEGDKAEQAFRKAMKTEEAYRIRSLVKNCEDKITAFNDLQGMDSFLRYLYPGSGSLLDAFPERTLVVLDEPNRLTESGKAAQDEFVESMQQRLEKGYCLPGQTDLLFDLNRVAAQLTRRCCVGLCTLDVARAPWKVTESFGITAHAVNPYNNSFDMLVKDLMSWKKSGYRVILLSASRTRGERLSRDLLDEGLNAFYSQDADREVRPGELMVTWGRTGRGYEYPLLKFVVISETDIFGKEKRKRTKRQRLYHGDVISSFRDLHVGDYVVHESHGLAVYRGIEQIETDHVIKDYMKLEYEGGSCLYVLTTSLDVIQKYKDADAGKVKLNKLGTQEWNRTKTRVRTATRQIAQELIALYADREKKKGFVYGPDTVWQKEFEEMFPFEETEDQLAAIADTKADMQSGKIMDRLICGDVGYGKTEIALRAAFKAVQEGFQVAFLVPTTILAQQHYNTFIQRMKDFPVRVDLMCRFRTGAELKKTVADLKRGAVDVVIGTHRLLSKDVSFKNLGLLVIDEEQRFGVTHKEKIKHMKHDVDVLTLTATPIPRTLHMSLTGIRDMSVLAEAPQDRLPIQTFVMEYNEELVREAISRELARNGQVYYVYNRVNTILDQTARIQALLPQARVAFAHGQMRERELEAVMYDFISGDVDVLVCTTIIETGLDIPNANTMIVHNAETMGLSQLYQLRGRIGRSRRTSYAFLMYNKGRVLDEVAEKRLAAIREFTELGSGIKIAMRDLEIRGAGNLLGSEQHGHMEAVGYDLYCKMLGESVKELKGEVTAGETFETVIDLDVDAYIPSRYISSENQKLDIYKRIAAIDSETAYDEMNDELTDRFGDPPASVINLLQIARLKAAAHEAYFTEITQRTDEIVLKMYEKAPVDISRIEPFVKSFSGRLTFRADKTPYFLYHIPKVGGKKKTNMISTVSDIIDRAQTLKIQ